MLSEPIAIVGMECQVPGASSVRHFWNNLKSMHRGTIKLDGADSAGMHIAVGYLDNYNTFDYQYFHVSKKEACYIDPQHRLFITSVANLLENYKNQPFTTPHFGDNIGIFSSCPMNTFLSYTKDEIDCSLHTIVGLQSTLYNDKDYLALRTANVLNLTGPAVDMQTSCCSSATATHYACLSLINNDCDLAVAGGVSLMLPQLRPYPFVEGSIFSSDGQCNPFTSSAKGTVHGNGCGVILLKRLKDAIRDNDKIYSVIISSAINNNGDRQDGITAPSVAGWCDVINRAIDGIDIDTIGVIETHGTGTILGDAVEFEAIRKTFSAKTQTKNFCAIGTAKSHIGHLEAACGIINIIKASLNLCEELITPDVYPGAETIDLSDSPFYMLQSSKNWPSIKGSVRRVSVNSSGMGGTNVHIVLEEAPKNMNATLDDCYSHPSRETFVCWPDIKNSSGEKIGIKVKDTIDEINYELPLNISSYKWIKEHRLAGSPVIPGTFFIYLLNNYIKLIDNSSNWMFENIQIKDKLLVNDTTTLRVSFTRDQDSWNIKIESRSAQDNWNIKLHMTAKAVKAEQIVPSGHIADFLRGPQIPLEPLTVYKNQLSVGLYHGDSFQKIKHAVKVPQGILGIIADYNGELHNLADKSVCLLDSCLQLFRFAHNVNNISNNSGYLLTSLEKINIANIDWSRWKGFWCLAVHRDKTSDREFITDFAFFTENGEKIGEIIGAKEVGVGLLADNYASVQAPSQDENRNEKSPLSTEDIAKRLISLIAETLGTSPDDITPSDTLGMLGVDSFSTLDLSIEIQKILESKIDFLDEMRVDSSIEKIAQDIYTKLNEWR